MNYIFLLPTISFGMIQHSEISDSYWLTVRTLSQMVHIWNAVNHLNWALTLMVHLNGLKYRWNVTAHMLEPVERANSVALKCFFFPQWNQTKTDVVTNRIYVMGLMSTVRIRAFFYWLIIQMLLDKPEVIALANKHLKYKGMADVDN